MSHCAVSSCRMNAKDDPYCPIHSLFSPDLLRSTTAQDKFDTVLKTLSYQERECAKLYTALGDGYSYTTAEIGRIFKIEMNKVRTILHRIVKKIRANPSFVNLLAVNEVRSVLVVAYDELVREIAKDPQNIFSISPRRFEEIVAYILKQFGFTVDLTAQTRDGGADIIAATKDALGITTSYIVECKRFANDNRVGIATARALYGVKTAERKDHAIIATTSFFTRDAVKFSRRPEVINLHLRDFNSVMGWINEVTQERLPVRNHLGHF